MDSVNKQIIVKALPAIMLFIAIHSVIVHSKYIVMENVLNNTTVWWAISGLTLIIFLASAYHFHEQRNNRRMTFLLIYILWNAICIIRGAFVAEIYWDWKALIGNTMILMLPVAAYAATNIILVQSLLAYYVKYVLPLFLFFAFVIRTDAWGFYLMGVSLLLIFTPALTNRQRLLLIVFTIVVFAADLGARSNIIKFGVPVIFLSFFYLRNIISNRPIEVLRNIFFILPLIFFILGVTNLFNVFNMNDYLKKEVTSTGVNIYGERSEVSLTVDTRTFLYEEVLQSAKHNNYWMLGRTPARGNDSMTFGLMGFESTGRYERVTNEIGLANVFTWTGIVGVILYLALFYHASFLAVNRSNNIYVKILGLYIAFRWLFSWIEDYQDFTLNFLLLWIMIGLCLSDSFRKMTDDEVAFWARGIFDARYVRFQSLLIKKSLYEKSKDSGAADLPQQEG